MATIDEAPPKEQRWLRCHLDKGMFSDEVAVTYPSIGDWQQSVFVPKSDVQGSIGDEGRVRVSVFRHGSRLIAVLPNPNHDIVEVTEADLD